MSDFHKPLRLRPQFSYYFLTMLSVLYVGSGLILFSLTLPLPVGSSIVLKLSILLLIIVTAFNTIRYHLLLIDHPLYNCVITHQAIVTLASTQKGQLTKNCFSIPLVAILRVKMQDKKIATLVLFADALEPEIFRLLCVHLQHATDYFD